MVGWGIFVGDAHICDNSAGDQQARGTTNPFAHPLMDVYHMMFADQRESLLQTLVIEAIGTTLVAKPGTS